MDSLNRLLRERETRSAHGATTGTGSNTNTAASILLQRRLLTSFDVSFTREFDASCHGGGVQALDLDRQQRRFLLSASAVGCVAVYDLEGFEGSTGTAAGGRARCVPSAVR